MSKTNQDTLLGKILVEMVNVATKEVGNLFTGNTVEQIVQSMERNYGIILDYDAPITAELMSVISLEILEWKNDMAQNF